MAARGDVQERTSYVLGVLGFAFGVVGLVGGDEHLKAPAAAVAASCILLLTQHRASRLWRFAIWAPFAVTSAWLFATLLAGAPARSNSREPIALHHEHGWSAADRRQGDMIVVTGPKSVRRPERNYTLLTLRGLHYTLRSNATLAVVDYFHLSADGLTGDERYRLLGEQGWLDSVIGADNAEVGLDDVVTFIKITDREVPQRPITWLFRLSLRDGLLALRNPSRHILDLVDACSAYHTFLLTQDRVARPTLAGSEEPARDAAIFLQVVGGASIEESPSVQLALGNDEQIVLAKAGETLDDVDTLCRDGAWFTR